MNPGVRRTPQNSSVVKISFQFYNIMDKTEVFYIDNGNFIARCENRQKITCSRSKNIRALICRSIVIESLLELESVL